MLAHPTRQCDRDSARQVHGSVLVGLWLGLAAAFERARQRRALSALSDAILQDIGLTRRDVEAECQRSFWR